MKQAHFFSAVETTIPFMPHSKVSCRTDASSGANSCLLQIRCLFTLRLESSIISINSIIADNIIRKVIRMFRRKRQHYLGILQKLSIQDHLKPPITVKR